MTPPPTENFRVELSPRGVAHIVFDMPGRSMNVLADSAIHELGALAEWLHAAPVTGAVFRSGKASAFCVGADLAELGAAYDRIMAAPAAQRHGAAFDHFFPLSRALRRLETCGKPLAAAVEGLALGGGCELAMAVHHRVLGNGPGAALGVPESLVGLLPGGGGTQRLPRLVGVKAALPLLLKGERLAGQEALDAGVAHVLVPPGAAAAAAERWVLSGSPARQPWDMPGWTAPDLDRLGDLVDDARQAALARTLGHQPAPLAILRCLERGYPQPMDDAIRTEMQIFAGLIVRPEPRDMIAALFSAKLEHDRLVRRGELPASIQEVVERLQPRWSHDDLAPAGFGDAATAAPWAGGDGYWFDVAEADPRAVAVRRRLEAIAQAAAAEAVALSPAEQRLVDHVAVIHGGFPAYLGGPFSLLRQRVSGAG